MYKTKERIASGGKIMVSRHYGSKGTKEEMDFEDLPVRIFEVEPASVRAGYGLTINLGNYESARVDVQVTLPCYAEEVQSAIDEAFEIAEQRVMEAAEEVKEYAKTKARR